jgi:aspartate racemase
MPPVKTIGLIGGMSWESTVTYYRVINEEIARRLGGLHSARCLLWSFDFELIHRCQQEGRWEDATLQMVDAARALRRAGADFLVICTNTMHRMADEVQAAAGLPLLHIADATAERIKAAGLDQVGLLGTRFTMEQDFYRGRLIERHGLKVTVPAEADRQFVHDVIFGELCRGVVSGAARNRFRTILRELAQAGCGGTILGCTELGLLVEANDSPVPLFDTALIHAEAAAARALEC